MACRRVERLRSHLLAPNNCAAAAAGPASGLLLLEHVNVNCSSRGDTVRFFELLGCQFHNKVVHMNAGPHTQFHLPVDADAPQRWRGFVTVARLRSAKPRFASTTSLIACCLPHDARCDRHA